MVKKLLVFLLSVLLLCACSFSGINKNTDNPLEDTPALTFDEFEEYPSEMFGGAEPIVDIFPSPLMVKASGVGYITPEEYQVYDEFYIFYEVDAENTLYKKEDFKYIGDVAATVGELDKAKWNSFDSNYLPVGTEIYRINAMSLYVEYIYEDSLHRAVGEMVVKDDPPPLIFVEGELYVFFDSEKGSRYDTDDLEYLGSVAAVTSKEIRGSKLVPNDEFVSSSFPIGTKLYRIDEDALYLEHDVALSGSGTGFGNLYSFIGNKYKDNNK